MSRMMEENTDFTADAHSELDRESTLEPDPSLDKGGDAKANTPHPLEGRQSMLAPNVGKTERLVSMIGGGAMAVYGLRQGSKLGYTLAATGLGLAVRGATGHCPVYGAAHVSTAPEEKQFETVEVKESITINQAPEEVYRFWRNFENLPRFMDHLESVSRIDDRRSHWIAKAPLGRTVSWDAEITEDEEGTHIAWRSLPGSQIMNTGIVMFRQAPGGRGTELVVHMAYQPPAGSAGRAVASLTGEEPKFQIHNGLMRLKRILETGEVPTTEGQSHGARSLKGSLLNKREG